MIGCDSCDTIDGKVAGCKNNGGCLTGGCNKMNVFDWLSDMETVTNDAFGIMEVRFKGGRKEYYRNSGKIEFTTGEAVIVDVPSGHHLGHVSLQGELVRLQMSKKKISEKDDIRNIYRKASIIDLDKFRTVKDREMPALYRTRDIIDDLKLEMKLSDVEFQADNTKATFYYSADDRVDFRELIKRLATEFKIRVEMRQISLRQEAGRLGGIGSCGREVCCSTWLGEFRTVSTGAARYQNLSLNPSKLSGQCGRLKCCLNYELDTYMEALEDIPQVSVPLITEKGEATLQKTDIFRKIMWFGYKDESAWHPVHAKRVGEILAMNENGKIPANLNKDMDVEKAAYFKAINSDLERMDKKYRSGKKKKRFNKNRNKNRRRGSNS